MMEFTLFLADCTGNKANCKYPHEVTVRSADGLADAVTKDHVCGAFTDNYRSNKNFLTSDGIVMDCDNDHSDNPVDWVTPEMLQEELADYEFAITPSRHNMMQKGDLSPRPRFHVYFHIKKCTDAEEYAAMKVAIQKKFPFFDDNALDAARFLFGADASDVLWNEGWSTIDEDIVLDDTNENNTNTSTHYRYTCH